MLELLDEDPQPLQRSATLRSSNADYNTPPESPTTPNPLFKTCGESKEKPPVAPPRYKRKGKAISINASPIPPPASPTPVNKPDAEGADVLEAVANDLMKMGDDLDRQISNEGKGEKNGIASEVNNGTRIKCNEPLKGMGVNFLYLFSPTLLMPV